jgi:hypothetical protein
MVAKSPERNRVEKLIMMPFSSAIQSLCKPRKPPSSCHADFYAPFEAISCLFKAEKNVCLKPLLEEQ